MKKLFQLLLVLSLLSSPFIASADNTYYLDLEDTNPSEYLTISDASQTGLDLSGDATFEFWFNRESVKAEVGIINKDIATADQRSYMLLFQDSGTDTFYFRVSSDGTTANYSRWTWTGTFNTGTWYHIAIVYDLSEDKAAFYVDGTLDTDFALPGASAGTMSQIYNSNTQFAIGDQSVIGDNNGTMDGQLDDIRIWNDIRTGTEIGDNYDCQLTGSEDNLVSYWQFNNNATDETSNGNDLTEFNTPSYVNTSLPFTVECSAGGGATSTASSTIQIDTDWYSDDLTIITGRTDHYESSTTAPDWIRYHYFHIPFLAWVIIFSGIFIIGSRIILEIIIRFRNGKLR